MAGQPETNSYGGSVGINHRVVVDTTVIAQTNRGIVSLIHTKENVDWLCEMERESEGGKVEGRGWGEEQERGVREGEKERGKVR